jgi:hypothetical protein
LKQGRGREFHAAPISQTQGVFDGAIIHFFEITQDERGAVKLRNLRARNAVADLSQLRRRFCSVALIVGESGTVRRLRKYRAPDAARSCKARREIFLIAHATAFSMLYERVLHNVFGFLAVLQMPKAIANSVRLGVRIIISMPLDRREWPPGIVRVHWHPALFVDLKPRRSRARFRAKNL